MPKRVHEHQWIYNGRSCCYRVKCLLPGCEVKTTAYRVKGTHPVIGDRVQFVDGDEETIEKILWR